MDQVDVTALDAGEQVTYDAWVLASVATDIGIVDPYTVAEWERVNLDKIVIQYMVIKGFS